LRLEWYKVVKKGVAEVSWRYKALR